MPKLLLSVFIATLLSPLHSDQRVLTILTEDPASLGEYGLGIRLGVTEAERTAALLGHTFRFVHKGPALARVSRTAPDQSEVPTIAMTGSSSSACVFVTESPVAQQAARAYADSKGLKGYSIADWHDTFTRYGAAQLNERFERAFHRPMSAEAWHGWVAVKAITETALRDDDVCGGLRRLRFDGHKGRALRFDPDTRYLLHPALIIRDQNGKSTVEVVP